MTKFQQILCILVALLGGFILGIEISVFYLK